MCFLFFINNTVSFETIGVLYKITTLLFSVYLFILVTHKGFFPLSFHSTGWSGPDEQFNYYALILIFKNKEKLVQKLKKVN